MKTFITCSIPSAVIAGKSGGGRTANFALPDHDVHQLAGDDHHLADLFALQQLLNPRAGEGVALQLFAGGAGRDGEAVAQLAVHLDDEGDLVFSGDGGVEGRPGGVVGRARLAETLPELVAHVGGERREEEDQVLQRFG